ncbi:hypothetical protein WH91_03095 [Devosia psychrophila]|uniref:Transcriptional regulator, IclR family n=2 Tax=Devosia psychrophila TaxID=728005 RepID=A0A0F5Q2U2_9HYPH|nr:hypothetical protein WH91_03095 [Devosia psychrophila]SFD43461.1 transcriptional regulator, IclR family [Devosia psychrophila]
MTELVMMQSKAEVSRERGIDRVLKLMAYLNESGRPVRVAELPKALGAPRSTIYELVRVLTESGILELSGDDNKVSFGKLIYLYGINYMRENDVIRRGSAEVDALSRLTGETSELCVLNRNRQAIVHTHPGSRPMRISSQAGGQIPLPWTASGRLMLAHMTPIEIEALVSPEDLTLPDKRVMPMADFVADCIGARGSTILATSGLINSFTQCLASPIFGVDGRVQATICLVLPMDITNEQRAELQQTLIASGRKLSMDV